jgi:hypothetical protein
LKLLKKKYPSSFSHKEYETQLFYLNNIYNFISYLFPKEENKFFNVKSLVKRELEPELMKLMMERPKYTQIPRYLGQYARYLISFQLDYGSFRDLQRHRNGFCPIPLLTTEIGFHDWYIRQLPPTVAEKALLLIETQQQAIQRLAHDEKVSKEDLQYYIPLGYRVYCELEYDLAEIIYVSELRSGITVHPTLRSIAQQMAMYIRNDYPGFPIYTDDSESDFDVKRGLQDIIKR